MSDHSANHNQLPPISLTMEPKKAQIVASAMQVFIENGFNKTSMNDIVAASGLSKGGVYHYFSKKDDVILAVMDALFQNLQSAMMNNGETLAILTAPDNDLCVMDTLKKILEDILLVSEQNLKMSHFFFEMYSYSSNHAVFQSRLKQYYHANLTPVTQMLQLGIQRGEIKADINVNAIAMSIAAIFDGIGLATLLMPSSELDYVDSVRQGVLAILEGIRV